MNNAGNVVSIVTGLSISEYPLVVGDETYQVRRSVEAGTQRGFVIISDCAGKAVLVFSASFPDEHVHQLIVGWRAGFKQGRELGRQEGVSIVPGTAS